MFVERVNIGIFGKMNSGKSTVMNLLTQTDTSIVDKTPGTTADTKTCTMEVHGLGPTRLYDTAGADEKGTLGEKKKTKVIALMKECNLVLIVIDSSTKNLSTEHFLVETARGMDKQVFILFNVFADSKDGVSQNTNEAAATRALKKLPVLKLHKNISIDATNISDRQKLINFILENYENDSKNIELLPFLKKGAHYVLNIPMDAQTPAGRLLKPQAMTEEYITRHWAYPISFRMDLEKARGPESNLEKKRFLDFLDGFKIRPHAIITDSQAMDVMNLWTPDDIMLTTFSIVMINYLSKGRLELFVKGLEALEALKAGDKILIAEACNHSRIGEDIGTVQIPKYLKKRFPGIVIEHSFGKECIEGDYKLAIHCGGCMITQQKMNARIRDFINLKIPFTNYGLFLSYMQGKAALKKVLEPWK